MNSESSASSPKSRNAPAFLVGLLIGLVPAGIGAFFFVDRPHDDSMSSAQTSVGVEQSEMGANATESPSQITDVSDLEALLTQKSSYGRAISLQRITAGAGKQELNRLFLLAEDLSSSGLRDEIQTVVVQRLGRIDPENTLRKFDTFAEVRRNRLVGSVFQEWSAIDLEGSIEFAKNMSVDSKKTAALVGILRSRIDLSDTARREIAIQLGNEQFVLDQLASLSGHDAIDDPALAWREYAALHGTDVGKLSPEQRNLLGRIALSWTSRDGFGNMLQAMSASLADYEASVAIVGLLFDEVVAEDPRIVLDAAEGMDPEVRAIVVNALEILTAINPAVALEIAAIMESGSTIVALQRAVIGAWMDTDPKAVLDARNSMAAEFREWIEQSALMSMVRTLPEEVPPYIATIKNETAKEIVAINLSLNWARKDPMAVFEWLESEPEVEPWYGHIFSDVLENLTNRDPEEAMRFALGQPPREYDGIGWESAVVAKVAQSDMDAALGMTDRARDEQTRDSMMRSLGQVLINQAQFEKAMDWADRLKEEQRDEYMKRVVTNWVWGNPEQLYEKMDELPTDNLREIAADWLIDADEHQNAFSAEQIEELKKYLPEESAETL